MPVLAFTGDWLASARVASIISAIAIAWGAGMQWNVARAVAQGRIDRARFVPFRPQPIVDAVPSRVDGMPPIPKPPPPEPAVKQVENTRLVIVRDNGHYVKDSPSSVFASDGRPLFPTNRLIDGVPEIDLKYFCELIPAKGGHQRSKWLGCTMPSGRKVDPEYYALLVAPLVKVKAIEGRAPRVAGAVTCSPQTMKERLGIAP